VDYVDFGVDSSSRFLFRARTNRHADAAGHLKLEFHGTYTNTDILADLRDPRAEVRHKYGRTLIYLFNAYIV